jgi:tetratricopeptide (TPR) repeat protein
LRAYTLASIGSLAFRERRWEEAIKNLEPAVALYRELGKRFNYVRSLSVLGYALAKNGDVERGVSVLITARDEASEERIYSQAGQAMLFLGRLKAAEKTWHDARAHFEESATLFRKTKSADDLFVAWFELWQLEQEVGNDNGRARAETTLKRLLRRLESSPPEAEEFRKVVTMNRAQEGRSR